MHSKRALIIFCHPSEKSYTAGLRDVTLTKLKQLGYEILESNLYQMKFNPVVDYQDFTADHEKDDLSVAKELKKTYEEDTLPPDVASEMGKLKAADYIFYIAPMWCGSFPAMLKGWLERVVLRGAAYDLHKRTFENGYLKGKKCVIISTTGAPRDFFTKEESGQTLEEHYWHIVNVFAFAGMETLPIFAKYAIEGESEEKRKEHFFELEKYLEDLENLKPLTNSLLNNSK